METDTRISKRIAIAFHPKYTLSENQLIKYRNDLAYREEDEIDEALVYSREKLSEVLSNRGIKERSTITSNSEDQVKRSAERLSTIGNIPNPLYQPRSTRSLAPQPSPSRNKTRRNFKENNEIEERSFQSLLPNYTFTTLPTNFDTINEFYNNSLKDKENDLSKYILLSIQLLSLYDTIQLQPFNNDDRIRYLELLKDNRKKLKLLRNKIGFSQQTFIQKKLISIDDEYRKKIRDLTRLTRQRGGTRKNKKTLKIKLSE